MPSDIGASPKEWTNTRRPSYEVTIIRDARVPTSEPGMTLSADLFLPVGAGPVPALLTVLPYRKDLGWGILDGSTATWYAQQGFACLFVDLFGTGSSDGLQRPPFDHDEYLDAIAAIEWAAAQPWCNGVIGMWGHSYGALLSMRTAVQNPPALKAILPLMGPLDPERDFVHPRGERGDLGAITHWGMQTFLNQLVPPINDFDSAAEQQRWSDRLRHADPWWIYMYQHQPGDPIWRRHAVDASQISVPTFCIGGWRDIFCDATLRAFEQLRGPKKLLVGPWMHTMPDATPFEPVNFRNLSLEWWDYWLNDEDNGVMDQAPVTLYVQGGQRCWEQFDSWPPTRDIVTLRTGCTTDLLFSEASEMAAPSTRIASKNADPTVGVLSGGLMVLVDGEYQLVDQHEDDMHSISCTSQPLERDLVLTGRPHVEVRLAGRPPSRLVVHLADVDTDGRSHLICSGFASRPSPESAVELGPTHYRLPAGHRMRVVITESFFPRLWPAQVQAADEPLAVRGIEVNLPTSVKGQNTALPAWETAADGTEPVLSGQWNVMRGLVDGAVEVQTAQTTTRTSSSDVRVESSTSTRTRVSRTNPTDAVAHATALVKVSLTSGRSIRIRTELCLTAQTITANADIAVDEVTTFQRHWQLPKPDSGRAGATEEEINVTADY